MSKKWWFLVGTLLLIAASAGASTEEATKVLHVYGPGGPHHVIEECAALFGERNGVSVAVIRALPHDLERRLREDGDLYFGGAEYMLEEFDRQNPGVLDRESMEKLHPRRIGILVRKGNPLQIKGVEDLAAEGVDLLDVKLEKMRQFHGPDSNLRRNIRRYEYTGQQGVSAWRSTPTLDAWVTYRTWYLQLEDDADFIEIPGEIGQRYTPMALTRHTQHREEALEFISFLKSETARRIFEEHGWY